MARPDIPKSDDRMVKANPRNGDRIKKPVTKSMAKKLEMM